MPSLEFSDKLYHAVGYGGLSFLLACSLSIRPQFRHTVSVLFVTGLYALFDELTQELVPGRTFETWDLMADGTGILLGLCAYGWLKWQLSRFGWGRKLLHFITSR